MQQTLEALLELHKNSEVGDLGHVAREQVADVVAAGDLLVPRVGTQLLASQGDALLLLVDGEDDTLHLVALLDHLGGVADLLGPAHVRDVQETINPLLNLHEGSVGSQVAHGAGDHSPDGVVALHQVPGIGLSLLHTQGDLLLLVVVLEDNHGDLIAGVQHLRGMVDPACPGHLGDVDQTLDTIFKLHEGAVGHDVDHLALHALVDRVTLFHAIPGRGRLLLDAEGNTFALEVDSQNLDLDLLIHLHHLGGVRDPPPGHVGDVQQTVDSAQVHEHAEVGDVLDRAHSHLSLGDVLEQIFLQTLALLFQEFPARDHDVHALRIDLDDPCPHGLAQEIGNVVGAAQVDLTGWQEHVDAFDVHEQAALDLALHDALNLVALVVLGGDPLPGAQAIGPALGEQGHVVLVQPLVEDLELRSLCRKLIAEFSQGYGPLGLAADVHDHQTGALVDRVDFGDHDLADFDVTNGRVKGFVEFFDTDSGKSIIELALESFGIHLVLSDSS